MAKAMGEVLRQRGVQTVDPAKKNLLSTVTPPPKVTTTAVEEEKVTYIPIREINLDDNGLKDQAFAYILNALATQPALRRINYVHNEIGAKSIEELEKLLT